MEKDKFPNLKISKIVFNDASSLDVSEDDIIILVGPNNSGKSASLREINDFVLNGEKSKRKIIHQIKIVSVETRKEILEWLRQNSKSGQYGDSVPYIGSYSEASVERDWEERHKVGARQRW